MARGLGSAARTEAADRGEASAALRTTTITIGVALTVVLLTGLLLDRRIRRRARVATPVPAAAATAAAAAPPPEADLLLALVRRNDPLLHRQRSLLTDLDATTVDRDGRPVVAQVDRLATRMRRNGESLLLLAGLDHERAPTSATALADVVRDAVAEVTHYSRVDVIGLPTDVAVVGASGG